MAVPEGAGARRPPAVMAEENANGLFCLRSFLFILFHAWLWVSSVRPGGARKRSPGGGAGAQLAEKPDGSAAFPRPWIGSQAAAGGGALCYDDVSSISAAVSDSTVSDSSVDAAESSSSGGAAGGSGAGAGQ